MKKFITLIMITFALIGCVSEGLRQTYGDEWMEANSDWRSTTAKTTDETSSASRYCEQPVYVDNISYDWQGGPNNPVFAVFLFSPEAINIIKSGEVTDPKQMPKGTPCFKINISGNLTFSTKEWNKAQTIGVYDNLEMQYIDCLAAKFDGSGFVTLCLDKDRLSENQITVLGQDEPDGEALFPNSVFFGEMSREDFINMTACTVALVPSNAMYKTIGAFTDWAAELVVMNEAESFPENVEYPQLHAPYTPYDINYVIGTVSNTSTEAAAEANLINGEYTFTASVAGELWFKFIIAGNGYTYEIGAVDDTVQSLNADIPLKNGTYTSNVRFNAAAGATYKIAYNPQDPSCRIDVVSE